MDGRFASWPPHGLRKRFPPRWSLARARSDRDNFHFELAGMAENGRKASLANDLLGQLLVQVIDTGDGLAIKFHHDVSLLQASRSRGTPWFNRQHEQAALDREPVIADQSPAQFHVLPANSHVAP